MSCATEARALARRRRSAVGLAAGLVALGMPGSAAASLGEALDYLAARHDPRTGEFSEPGSAAQKSANSAWAALAISAAGESPATWRRDRQTASLADAIARQRPGNLGALERTIVARAAVGADPRGGRRDLVAELVIAQTADGTFGGTTLLTAWGVIALRAAGVAPEDQTLGRAVAALRSRRSPRGGWPAVPGARADVPTTATAIQALIAAGATPEDPDLAAARQMLVGAQRRDGGFPPLALRASTAIDTAWAAVAIRALGEDPAAAPWTRGRRGPLRFLETRQTPDGAIADQVGRAPSVFVTAVGALAFGDTPLPVAQPGRAVRRDRAPRVVARTPAAGRPRGALVTVRYRDAPSGTGVDAGRVRLRADGVDVTRFARISGFSLQIPGAALGSGAARLELALPDRAGNTRVESWWVGPPR